jgi:hypothetical protein
MATTFDEEEYEDIATAGGYGPSDDVEHGEEAAPVMDDVESQMSEAEHRLEIASYYKMLLNNGLFEGVENAEAAGIVEGEVREFVRTRLAALLGVAVKTQGLTPQQSKLLSLLADEAIITSLLELVSRLLKKPSLLQGAKKKLQEPSEPAAPVAKPTLRKARPEKKVAPVRASEPVSEVKVKPARSENPEAREVVEGPKVTGRKGRKAKVTQKVVTRGLDKDGNEIDVEVEQDLTRQTPTPKEAKIKPDPFIGATHPSFDAISGQHAQAALKVIEKKLRPSLGGG